MIIFEIEHTHDYMHQKIAEQMMELLQKLCFTIITLMTNDNTTILTIKSSCLQSPLVEHIHIT